MLETTAKAFIPFRNQENKIAKIARNNSEYLDILNFNITELKPPICFDWEREVSISLTEEQDKYIQAHTEGKAEPRTISEAREIIFPSMIAKFKPQRLVHLQPERIIVVNNTVGVECSYLGSLDVDLYLPKDVEITNHAQPLEIVEQYKGSEDYQVMMYGSCILAFIVDVF